ncbi:hypothetical protein Dimus_025361 [Dionaea muscipula]
MRGLGDEVQTSGSLNISHLSTHFSSPIFGSCELQERTGWCVVGASGFAFGGGCVELRSRRELWAWSSGDGRVVGRRRSRRRQRWGLVVGSGGVRRWRCL